MTADDPDLETAYALETPGDNLALYARWAETYDQSFARAMEFLMPGHVARLFSAQGGQGPVLDAGAGTGLVAEAMQAGGAIEMDALDLSQEMLAVAASKKLYRNHIVADLTQKLPLPDGEYNGVVSSGTFTHGHVGPEALDELMRVAAPGALFVLTVKTEHFEARGFAAKFKSFGDRIAGFSTVSLPIYGPGAEGAHKDDEGLLVVFRKT
ncbi:class I SAM-dependent methyltransferase [uncultured Roseobacter sp.]|uniref:class I SAM-dependent DNA methyltransferase n=1 Tax=uncultured Roseobacter sp. TaxID=114847 RepID=UPI0026060D12|nr:class I SAM-dependent methyltransferase [uncultured Roseobacter sp.]